MMTKEQAENVRFVYNHFLENEDPATWTDIDTNLEIFDWLTDEEMIKEAIIKYEEHLRGKVFRCEQEHEQAHCFAPYLLESVSSILSLYEETKILHIKNRYILCYYLVMSALGIIYAN